METLLYLFGEPQSIEIDRYVICEFDGEKIKLVICGCEVYSEDAKRFDVYVVRKMGKHYYLNKVGIPDTLGGVIAWLLKFNKHNRTFNYEYLEGKVRGECGSCRWNCGNCERKVLKSAGYEIHMCKEKNRTGYKSIAGWFSNNITKEEVLQLIPLMTYYDERLVKYLLGKHFDITEEEFDRVKNDFTNVF